MELFIVTPCCRPNFLPKLYDSIDFDKVTQWIIVYDTSKGVKYEKKYLEHPKIYEIECDKRNVGGGIARQQALDIIKDGFVYFLDDDNIIHPNFWNIFNNARLEKFYTFNCIAAINEKILYGDSCKRGTIDTGQYLIPRKLIGNTIWQNIYTGDGYFIEEIYNNHSDKHCYVNEIAAYYNYITKAGWTLRT
jgi:glycosyltransferase involved in cell wall biosynthesis